MGASLVQDERFREVLRKMIGTVSHNPCVQEDLLQEALLHLWKIETDKPDRTQSWYVQSCWFHLQHWLAAGRSVDSPKRCFGENRMLIGDVELPDYHTNGESFERVSFQDLVATLGQSLHPGELAVLRGLAKGMDLREICLAAGLSYPTALKYRRRIACLACKLDSCPDRLAPPRLTSDAKTGAPATPPLKPAPKARRGACSLPRISIRSDQFPTQDVSATRSTPDGP